jgi:cyclic pyranopterin phosphate synthase
MSAPKDRLTHTDQAGKASMVDVSDKPVTARTASASGSILMRLIRSPPFATIG